MGSQIDLSTGASQCDGTGMTDSGSAVVLAGFLPALTLHCKRKNKKGGDGAMKVSEILKVKGNILYTVTPDTPILQAVNTMAERDIGSLVVMGNGSLVGMLTFREVISTLYDNQGSLGIETVRLHMQHDPLVITPDVEINEARRQMLVRHARYVPVIEDKTLLGVISFYDIAKAVFEAQSFENKMLKAYIRDWPSESEE
jgi:CBS domain-containing protein